MWFKNLSVFRLTESFMLSAEELEEKLSQMVFRHCMGHEEFTFGWTAPIKNTEPLVHNVNGFFMLCGKREERVLPTAVVNEMLQEKIDEIEAEQGRRLPKKARTELKDNLIFELLPRAFSFSHKTYAYIDTNSGFIIINASSTKKAEDFLSNLRKCLGSLPAVPLNTVEKPIFTMTEWLLNENAPNSLTIEDECELRSPEEAGGIIRCKRHDLTLPEIKNHLDNGKQVIKLALNWQNRIAFILDENFGIKRLKFLELVQEQRNDIDAETEIEQFDADFTIMTAELAEFLPHLITVFGGENR